MFRYLMVSGLESYEIERNGKIIIYSNILLVELGVGGDWSQSIPTNLKGRKRVGI